MTKILFYGAQWCPDCRVSKRVLDEKGIDYEYVDLDKDPDAPAKVEELNDGMQSIPTIVFPNGEKLVEPTKEELLSVLNKLE